MALPSRPSSCGSDRTGQQASKRLQRGREALKIGDFIDGHVTKVLIHVGVLVDVGGGREALLPKEHFGKRLKRPQAGYHLDFLKVLDVDPEADDPQRSMIVSAEECIHLNPGPKQFMPVGSRRYCSSSVARCSAQQTELAEDQKEIKRGHQDGGDTHHQTSSEGQRSRIHKRNVVVSELSVSAGSSSKADAPSAKSLSCKASSGSHNDPQVRPAAVAGSLPSTDADADQPRERACCDSPSDFWQSAEEEEDEEDEEPEEAAAEARRPAAAAAAAGPEGRRVRRLWGPPAAARGAEAAPCRRRRVWHRGGARAQAEAEAPGLVC